MFDADPAATMDRVLPRIYTSSPTNRAALSDRSGAPLTVSAFLAKQNAAFGA